MSASEVEEQLLESVSALPASPGVYLFKDEKGHVLYVGKAQSLRGRVRSYFGAGGDGRHQVHFLVPRIRDVEVVVTGNVKEALLLENQLIKKHRPRFNVRLRDDKNYLALRIDTSATYPRFTETRSFKRDGAVYFGPFTSSLSMRETLDTLQKIFPLRTCSDNVLRSYQRRGRPCLEYSLGRCAGPCCGLVEDEDYADLVDGAILFMRGRTNDLVRSLREQMNAAAADERFEEAARLRDRLGSIERTVERQAMISPQFVDRDVFAIAREGPFVEVQTLHVRRGKLMGGNSHPFHDVRIDDAEALGSFLSQFYEGDRDIPREILVPWPVEGGDTLEEVLRERTGRALKIVVPRRGERRRLLEMAERNAELALAERTRREASTEELLSSVQALLRLPDAPRHVECYDVSHLRGTMHVASRVVFRDGRPSKDGYRRYKLREAAPGDDYGAMREILRRRLSKLDREPAPDLILLDGGKGQLNAVRAVARDLGLDAIPLAAIAKERDEGSPTPRVKRHAGTKRERIFLPGVKDPLQPPADHPGLRLLQRVRDESHRFAIRYHRELRRKLGMRSILDELPGIGPVKRRALLRGLGSLERVGAASVEALAAIPKVSRGDAERIYQFFHAADVTPAVKGAPEGVDEQGDESREGSPDAPPNARIR